MDFYPAFLNLHGKKVVVVGGGKVAERKVLTLLKSGAKISVVSPTLTRRLSTEYESKSFKYVRRNFEPRDVRHAFLVISATDSSEINRKVAENSPALVNVVDVPSQCNFIAPSVVERGSLLIAISTSGTSPSLAKAIRQELEKAYGPEFSGYLKFLKRIRSRALAEIPEPSLREKFLKGVASEKLLKTLRSAGLTATRKMVLSSFETFLRKNRR